METYTQSGSKNEPTENEKITAILKKPSNLRSVKELKLLLPFMSHLKMFNSELKSLIQNFNVANQYEVAKTMECKHYNKGEVVYQYSTESNQIYVIIQGSVELSIPQKTITVSSLLKEYRKSNVFDVTELKDRSSSNYEYKTVTELSSGQSFGEKSLLISKLTNNKATCTSDTILAIIHK